jgi:microfibrillar-associated protein 1
VLSLVKRNLNPSRRHPPSSFVPSSSPSGRISLSSISGTHASLRRARVTVVEKDLIAQDTEEATKRKEAEAEERKKQSHDMVAESIRRELAESTLHAAHTCRDAYVLAEEQEENVPDVDDTDGLDPEAEFEAWRLRELGRIKREKEDEVRREEEREEIERRRALPEEQRLREDMERADKTRADKPKGQQKFLQKYWHKGAFHQVSVFSVSLTTSVDHITTGRGNP